MSLETKCCAILFQSEANPIKKEILQLVISPQLAINKHCNISKKIRFSLRYCIFSELIVTSIRFLFSTTSLAKRCISCGVSCSIKR